MTNSYKGSTVPRAPDINRLRLYERIGRRIRKVRNEKQMEVGELATRSGTIQQSISKIEQGEMPPPVHLLVAIAKALGVTLNDLVPMEESDG